MAKPEGKSQLYTRPGTKHQQCITRILHQCKVVLNSSRDLPVWPSATITERTINVLFVYKT